MEEIRRQVSRARWRMIADQFVGILGWSMFASLLLAVAALAVPKIWAVDLGGAAWAYGWLAGGVAVGLLSALMWTWLIRRGALETAIEIDRRFGLKERVSSTLALTEAELQTEAGQALVQDASRRVERIDIADQFQLRPNWRPLLPFLPMLAAFALVLFVQDATQKQAEAAASTVRELQQRAKASSQQFKTQVANAKKRAEEKGLEDAQLLIQKLEENFDKLGSKNETERKQAMVKIHDLVKNLEQKRDSLGGAEKMREHLDQLKDLQKGPADKFADAVKDGKFGKAVEEIKKLQEKLKNGELTEQDQKDLAKQLQQMKQKLDEMAEAHQQAKDDLQRQIQQKLQEGDLAGAGKLQQQLDRLNSQQKQLSQIQQMAQKLGQCSQSLQEGNTKDAADQLAQLGGDLQELQDAMEELEMVDDLMNQIADAKNSMNCTQCNGQGCEACQGDFGMEGRGGTGKGDGEGNGLGEGQGQGERPEEQTDTGSYLSKVGQQPKAGESVRVGDASGPNRAGVSRQQAKDEILSELTKEADPLNNEALPKQERDHAREYFKRFSPDGE